MITVALGVGVAYYLADPDDIIRSPNTETSAEIDLSSFENSFNSDQQLTPTPQN